MKHWQQNIDSEGYSWLTLDRQDSSTNVLTREVLEEFDQILDQLHKNTPRGIAILSGKKNGFIAGANISEFIDLKTVPEAIAAVEKVQKIFNKLEALSCPTVVAINGFCLGGGYELSLACKHRIAIDSPKTKIGLPEVLLGIQPGWGGSIRMPKLIGSLKALPLIVAGRVVDARVAAKLGMVDAVVPERNISIAIKQYLSGKTKPRKAGFSEKIIQLPVIRHIIGLILKSQIVKKVNKKHYPAPFAVVSAWMKTSIYSTKAMQREAESIAKLMLTNTAKNLVKVFFLRDRLKSSAKTADFNPKHVHVIGAGVMGGDIAIWCALQGFTVSLQDNNLKAMANTIKRAHDLYSKKLKVPFLVKKASDRIVADSRGDGIKQADVIIEAIIEDAAAKQNLFTQLENEAKPTAILATNTSTIPLATIAKNLKNPSRIVGLHFFNPVSLMPLVEVVTDKNTDKSVVNNAMAFVGKLEKLPLEVASVPGFLVNRTLIPYLLESAIIVSEGVAPKAIDKAVRDFGMPMGPIELMDAVGLDICVAAGKSMNTPMPEYISTMFKNGNLGKKTGAGFYKYKNGKIQRALIGGSAIKADTLDRIILGFVNEAVAVLRERVVTDADLVDAGMIFGSGFAPFLGGPLQYVKSQGKEHIYQKLENLAKVYGDRFKPDAGLS